MTYVLMLFLAFPGGKVQVKQVKGMPSEQVCKQAGERAMKLANAGSTFDCFTAQGK